MSTGPFVLSLPPLLSLLFFVHNYKKSFTFINSNLLPFNEKIFFLSRKTDTFFSKKI